MQLKVWENKNFDNLKQCMGRDKQNKAEINKIELTKIIINEKKVWFFEKINNIDKLLVKLKKINKSRH